MQAVREDKLTAIFDEVARGSNLERVLGMIAGQAAASLGAPVCKIWVVKRGDICDRCPLAEVCTNRQMCLHLAAVSGATMDREYRRIPLSLLDASLIAHGGTSLFNDSGAGDRLFGLQRGAAGEGRDSYALYPLRGAAGTVGLMGVFNYRPIEPSEIQTLAEIAPAAVAAIRVAELQTRVESLRLRAEREAAQVAALEQSAENREHELEDAVAQLTRNVAQLQVERESLLRAAEEARGRIGYLEDQNRQLRQREDSVIQAYQEGGRGYSEKIAELEAERRRLEDESAWLKGQCVALEQSVTDISRQRDGLAAEATSRVFEVERLKIELEAKQVELASSREAAPRLENKLSELQQENAELRLQNTSITQGVEDLEYSLRIAEDARARLEQASATYEEKVAQLADEVERLRLENSRVGGENDQLVTETERLRGEVIQLEETFTRLNEDNSRIIALHQQLSASHDAAVAGASRLEQENLALREAGAQMQEAIGQFQALTARLEEGADKLRDRAEASERARSELEQRNRALAEQNRRLVSEGQGKARLLAGMSHELRTPMNAIIGFTSLLLEDPALNLSDRHRRSLERVSRNARDLLELINNVLDLSKIEAGRTDVYSEPADARDLIERAISVVEPLAAGKHISLGLEVERDLPGLRTDRTKLQQILINLLSNAVKFTHEGEVKVSARRAGAASLRISVTDTGIGISESDLPRIFEEFRQIPSNNGGTRSGTGLGLTITRRLVELLDGEISVSSVLGRGSTFTVTLPIEIEGRLAPAVEAEGPLEDPERTALVIDGDPAALYLLKKYLAEAGYSVAATDDLARGLEVARVAGPAVVTVDLDLSEEALAVVGELAGSEKKSVIITLSTDASAEAQARGAGAAIFLRKPVDRKELLDALKRQQEPSAGRVLAVDDDPDALDLVVAMLEGSGYEIQTATNGRAALEEISRTRPDAIVLDLMLPEMDGFEVVHRLSLSPDWREIPIILITARDLSNEERRALDTGTARIIQKGSFSRDELLAEIGALTSNYRGEAAFHLNNVLS